MYLIYKSLTPLLPDRVTFALMPAWCHQTNERTDLHLHRMLIHHEKRVLWDDIVDFELVNERHTFCDDIIQSSQDRRSFPSQHRHAHVHQNTILC